MRNFEFRTATIRFGRAMVRFKDGTIALLTRNSEFKGAIVEFGAWAIGF